ncbi:hypothetical protein HG437_001715 [Candidatus Saccharibacteria bacterium]|nr:hypothetical protein [Candidatus Saccharibacteria bacterium]
MRANCPNNSITRITELVDRAPVIKEYADKVRKTKPDMVGSLVIKVREINARGEDPQDLDDMVAYIDYYDAPFEDDIGSIELLLSAQSRDLYEEFDAQLQTVRDQLDVLARETEDKASKDTASTNDETTHTNQTTGLDTESTETEKSDDSNNTAFATFLSDAQKCCSDADINFKELGAHGTGHDDADTLGYHTDTLRTLFNELKEKADQWRYHEKNEEDPNYKEYEKAFAQQLQRGMQEMLSSMSASLDKIADIADIIYAKAESAEQSINSLGTALEVFHYTHNSGAVANDDDIES